MDAEIIPLAVRVLLVDDQPIIAEAMRRMLAGGPDIVFFYCQDPRQALQSAVDNKPTVVLIDLIMPGLNGMDLLREFRANAETSEIPLVILSGDDDATTKSQAFGAGADDYLVKLPDKLELIARVRYHGTAYLRLLERNAATLALQDSQHELKRQGAQLQQLNLQLSQATAAKSNFLATMSHEIRTPLNGIIGMSQLLSETPLTDVQKNYVDTLQATSEILLILINDILDFSKIEAGQIALERIPFRWDDIIAKISDIISSQIRRKQLQLESIIDPDVPPALLGDPSRIQQILLNLVSNAVKFTEHGKITIHIAVDPEGSQPGALRCAVIDTGIGIPDDKLKAIFERFTQADDSITRRHGGTGLGLAISRELVALMGGRMWVESTVGVGSVFYFTVCLDETTEIPTAKSTSSTDALTRVNQAPLNILVVDDSQLNRVITLAYLEGFQGYIDVAENGLEALRKVQDKSYDLVLMDMQMPVLDGYGATQQIRDWERAQGRSPVPIIAITAHAFKEDEEKCIAAGCTAYVSKPIKKRVLLETIVRHTQPGDSSIAEVANDDIAQLESAIAAARPAYLANVAAQIVTMRSTCASRDFAAISLAGHKLHGSGASYHFPEISVVGAALERGAENQDEQAIDLALAQLEKIVASSAGNDSLSPPSAAPGEDLAAAVKALRPLFLATARDAVVAATTALDEADFDTVARVGHMLAGDAGGYGFEQIGLIGHAIEISAKANDKAAIQRQLTLLKPYVESPPTDNIE